MSSTESGAGCMEARALVLRAAAGTATTGAGTGRRRRSRSANGCDRSSRRLRKQEPADEQETEYFRRIGRFWQGASPVRVFVAASLQQLIAAARLPNSGICEIAVNASLAFIDGAKPRDEIESALVIQMACAHS